jgi:hypothetical protein
MPRVRKNVPTKDDVEMVVASQLERVARALEVQNEPVRRFLLGIFFGVGTAIGATILTSAVLFFVYRILSVAGIQIPETSNSLKQIQKQIEYLSPNDF